MYLFPSGNDPDPMGFLTVNYVDNTGDCDKSSVWMLTVAKFLTTANLHSGGWIVHIIGPTDHFRNIYFLLDFILNIDHEHCG